MRGWAGCGLVYHLSEAAGAWFSKFQSTGSAFARSLNMYNATEAPTRKYARTRARQTLNPWKFHERTLNHTPPSSLLPRLGRVILIFQSSNIRRPRIFGKYRISMVAPARPPDELLPEVIQLKIYENYFVAKRNNAPLVVTSYALCSDFEIKHFSVGDEFI